ncbi:MAG: hypothetical protein QOD51_3112 [Candidatus Eremiobacteraeota bacterium]|jgi:hypothetical protein|nr:hypothetical protein [Candidatus Eremiobacteraeota bacterium]
MLSVRRALLTVLSAWHGLAAFKNLCDLCAEFDLVPAAARFRSKNFGAMENLLAPARLPREALGVLLAGVAAVETAIAVGFARGRDEPAFSLAILLFGSFALIDETMTDYELDETHRDILVFILVARLVIGRHDSAA